MENLSQFRNLEDYLTIIDDLLLIYLESEQCDNDSRQYRSTVANCCKELKEEIQQAMQI